MADHTYKYIQWHITHPCQLCGGRGRCRRDLDLHPFASHDMWEPLLQKHRVLARRPVRLYGLVEPGARVAVPRESAAVPQNSAGRACVRSMALYQSRFDRQQRDAQRPLFTTRCNRAGLQRRWHTPLHVAMMFAVSRQQGDHQAKQPRLRSWAVGWLDQQPPAPCFAVVV